jgi:hypothetical protein
MAMALALAMAMAMGKDKKVKPSKRVCIWKYDEYDNTHETSCGEMYYFPDGDVKENHYKYCPFCGKKIKEVRGA